MAKKKVAEKPKTDVELKVAELQKKRETASVPMQVEIDRQISELTK